MRRDVRKYSIAAAEDYSIKTGGSSASVSA